jgi:Na+-transporting methylmalonyl-CoA/oxaloacetate decarboxylase gamma subunit
MNRMITQINKWVLGLVVGLVALLNIGNSWAQSSLDLRFNEVLIYNDSNYVDDFGRHGAWIEVFNTAYNTVDMGGLYLTNDLSNPTMYKIPKGQPVTAIAPRSYLVFWADGIENHGVLHLNFKLEESRFIALFDANGKTLIDSLTLPVNAKHDITFGRITDGGDQWAYLEKSTPKASNQTTPSVTGAELFGKLDPNGSGMMLIAMGVVFSALALLFFFFKYLGRVFTYKHRKNGAQPILPKIDEHSGEINAAIALALFFYRDQLHDQENTVLTINKVAKAYSPWSSKIYGLRKWPRS